jgi:hypothetical protein
LTQGALLPVMLVGAAGALPSAMALVCGMDVPQLDVAVTEIVPAVVPGVTEMELVVELPDQPAGNVQAYVVPATLGTE